MIHPKPETSNQAKAVKNKLEDILKTVGKN